MKTVKINGQQIQYTGTFIDIQIHKPDDLSFSEECELIAQIQQKMYRNKKEKYNQIKSTQ